jgi:threonine dehydrogenase-like Zn-dependent dehydrogenase
MQDASSTMIERTKIMKALVYHGPGKRAWEEVPDAVVQETTDAVVRVDAVTICGTDLWHRSAHPRR